MLGPALAAVSELDPQRLVVVAGHGRDEVSAEAARYAPGVCVVEQERLAGTGHAVRIVTEALGVLPGTVVVTYGDMPLLRAPTLAAVVREQAAAGKGVTVLTARVSGPSGYGRIIRDDGGLLVEIVEEADATAAQRTIDEINSGCYAFDGALLADAVKRVATGNAQSQEYLTDVVAILRGAGHQAGPVLAPDPPHTHAGTAPLHPPRLRAVTRSGPGAHIGTHVELKNSTVGEGAKVPHLSYVGDADIGAHANIGAATIFVNYDGVAKHRSAVGDHVRIGADTMLVAPVQIRDCAYTAARA